MTATSKFGVSKREGHDASAFYARKLVEFAEDLAGEVKPSPVQDTLYCQSSESMSQLADDSVALMVTSPPYHCGREYDTDESYEDYLGMLRRVLMETYRVLQPGGRAVVNVAGLGRKPYVPLQVHVDNIMTEIGYLSRGWVIWAKGRAGGCKAGGNCAWGSWMRPSNPAIRDVHEFCLIYSKQRLSRAVSGKSTIEKERFIEDTLSIWYMLPASAKRLKHPAPFPLELPSRFIQLYTFEGEMVLDPFMGSGTTAVAAAESGRHWIGYDTSQEYCQIAMDRIGRARPYIAGESPVVDEPEGEVS